MADPYDSPVPERINDAVRPPGVWAVAAFIAAAGLIILNNATSTNEQRDATDVFPEVVFYLLPLAMYYHLDVADGALSNRQLHLSVLSGYTLISGVPLLFLVTFGPLLVGSDYESFVAADRLFGPYGWYRWAWLILCGILPLLLFVHKLATSRISRLTISCLAIIGHIHNAWFMWIVCH